jgi:hypothetical protein
MVLITAARICMAFWHGARAENKYEFYDENRGKKRAHAVMKFKMYKYPAQGWHPQAC